MGNTLAEVAEKYRIHKEYLFFSKSSFYPESFHTTLQPHDSNVNNLGHKEHKLYKDNVAFVNVNGFDVKYK